MGMKVYIVYFCTYYGAFVSPMSRYITKLFHSLNLRDVLIVFHWRMLTLSSAIVGFANCTFNFYYLTLSFILAEFAL